MRKYGILWVLICFISLSATAQNSHKIKVLRFSELQKTLQSNADTLYVVNFWATWCKPCVMELPSFEKAHQEFKQKNVKILLVSLDFESDLQTKLVPFVQRKKLQPEVWLLNETDYNSFIDKVDASWQGAIPATLFFNNARKKRHFVEKELKLDELNTLINKLL